MQEPDQEPEIVSRAEAKARGLSTYFTGRACKRGHVSKRNARSKVCYACHREDQVKARADDPGRIKLIKAASYLRHREEVLAKVAAYQEANKSAVKKRTKAYRQANKAKISERFKTYAKANRDLMRVHERRRKMRHRNAPGDHTLADIRALEKAQGWLCANPRCRADLVGGYQVDHIQPLAKFGCNCANNLQLLCEPCNQGKGDKAPADWLREVGHHLGP